jgi:molecular chaperone IbpA
MRHDWTPLWQSTVGFDHLFSVFDEVHRAGEDKHPPYNMLTPPPLRHQGDAVHATIHARQRRRGEAARFENGGIELERRIAEAMKPRKIAINAPDTAKRIEPEVA